MSAASVQDQLAGMAEDALTAFNKARANGEGTADYLLGYRTALCDALYLIDSQGLAPETSSE